MNKVPKQQPGISLIELMITLVISSILIGMMATQGPSIAKTGMRLIGNSRFNESYYLFLIRLEKNFQEAESTSNFPAMLFMKDSNLDGDYADSAEKIQFRWNESKKRIELKSGSGYFQSLLEGVVSLKWEKTASPNPENCFQLSLKSYYDTRERLQLFCRMD